MFKIVATTLRLYKSFFDQMKYSSLLHHFILNIEEDVIARNIPFEVDEEKADLINKNCLHDPNRPKPQIAKSFPSIAQLFSSHTDEAHDKTSKCGDTTINIE